LFPHNAIRSNTIFEVVRSHGGHTAWADKHPAYDLVNGPSGKGVQDLFTPEITNNNGFDNTVSVVCTVANDQLKVSAVLNEIRGLRRYSRAWRSRSVRHELPGGQRSVGQKLEKDNSDGSCTADTQFTGQPGGYLDGSGTPTAVLEYGLQKTDAALGSFISALKAQGIYESTLFIVTARPVADQSGEAEQAGTLRGSGGGVAGRGIESGRGDYRQRRGLRQRPLWLRDG
jgi:hypothetical protein